VPQASSFVADPGVGVLVPLLFRQLQHRLDRLVLVAVVCLVVEHDDLLFAGATEVPQDPGDHRLRGLPERIVLLAREQQFAGVGGDALDLLGVLEQERVTVGGHGVPQWQPDAPEELVQLAM